MMSMPRIAMPWRAGGFTVLFDKNTSRGKKVLVVLLLLAAIGGFIALYFTAGK